MTEQSDTNVIQAFGKKEDLGECPMTVKRENYNFCQHERIEADTHSRVLIRHGCGATLDAFNFVLSQAKTMQRAWARYAHLQREAQELVGRVDALKKKEQRIKARVKRARDAAPTIFTRTP